MRLLFLRRDCFDRENGAELRIRDLFASLTGRGHDVHLLADESHPVDGICIHQGLERVEDVRRALEPDLTIDWNTITRDADVHYLGGIYAAHSQGEQLRALRRFMPRLAGKRLRQAGILAEGGSGLWAISRLTADTALRAGADPSRITVIHNGVHTARFRIDPGQRRAAREELGWTDEHFVGLFYGAGIARKNLAFLEPIVRAVAAERPEFRLLAVGPGNPELGGPVTWSPLLPGGAATYAAADLVLHPSSFDPFGNVVLEAMSCSLPVLTSNRAGAAELIDDGRDGFVLPLGDDARDLWVERIVRLAEDAGRRAAMGTEARRTALGNDHAAWIDKVNDCLNAWASRRVAMARVEPSP